VADLKKERLLRWLEERCGDVVMVSRNQMVADNVALLRTAMRESSAAGVKKASLWTLIGREDSYRNLVDFLDAVKQGHQVYDEIYNEYLYL
jgi:hypothetical protein